MEKEQLKRIFKFLEEKGEHRIPLKWKLINNIPLIEGDLNVKGSLDLDNTKITSLPEGLKVGGDLVLHHLNITSLPEGLKVGGTLFLPSTKITSLPEGLEVGGDLHLSHCKQLTSLPEGLKVGGGLFIYETPLKKYTNKELRGMLKYGFIKGKIYRK